MKEDRKLLHSRCSIYALRCAPFSLYLGDELEENQNNNQQKHQLSKLLSKIDERKRLKTAKEDESETVSTKYKTPGKEVGSGNKSENKQLDTKLDQQTPSIKLKREKHKAGTEVDGFTILGTHQFGKKKKVKRVLPNWLANPTIISTNLQKLTTSVEDVPGIDEDLVQKLKENNIIQFFPVQSHLIPYLLSAHNKPRYYWPSDVCVSSPTGSGKTLAFVIPIVQALKKRVAIHIRALVVLPVQDLAMQVYEVFKNYCEITDLKVLLVTGQNSFKLEQRQLVRTCVASDPQTLVDIVVTTPGRLVDHLQYTPGFSLKNLRFLVIDEADRIIENIQDDWLYYVEKHINKGLHPPPLSVSTLQWYRPPPQKLLFSATLSQDPEKLHQLALFQPKLFTSVINESSEIGENIKMSKEIRGDFIGKYTTPLELREQFCVVEAANKPTLLYHLIKSNGWKHVLCFTNTRIISHRLSLLLKHLGEGEIKVAEISTALKRAERNQILSHFAAGKIDVLVSTDAFARGMDILDVKFVISFDPPKYVKNYIHRVGRTGRAGKVGNAITFLLESQRGQFTEMLQEAGKVVKELTVPSKDFEYLTSHNKKALAKLNQVLEEEKDKNLKSMKFQKKHKFSVDAPVAYTCGLSGEGEVLARTPGQSVLSLERLGFALYGKEASDEGQTRSGDRTVNTKIE
uniref:ATP-dependent RNA helicase n=1 Tax=Timema cristinae TaxID=61476 RepID=A0A7R9CPU2_TIMCR|nr:unnamed protein product [Timema cristinae]